MDGFKDQLKQFIIDNGVIGTCAGVCIALVTKDVILSLVSDIIIPIIILLLSYIKIKFLIKMMPGKGKHEINLINFLNQFITWILVIIITFLFIRYSLLYFLGIDKNIKKKDK